MSLYKNYYIIAGYDLTGYATDKYEDWKWTDEGEQYMCRQIKGNIQLFDDPCNGEHLYFGYVLAHGDQYDFQTCKFCASKVDALQHYVMNGLFELIKLGVIDEECKSLEQYKVIAFEEVN